MVDTAAMLVDEVLPTVPICQWVLSVPFPLRFLCAREPAVMSAVLGVAGIRYRTEAWIRQGSQDN